MTGLRFFILFFSVLFACSRGVLPPQAPTTNPTQALSNMPTGGSSIIGVVSFEGTPPQPTTLQMASFPECRAAHPQGIQEDVLIKDGKIQNVFVYVKEGVSGDYPSPATTITLDQRGCVYAPHVFGIQVGQPLLILNSDPMIHNVHAVKEAETVFNVAMPAQGQKLTQTFSQPQVMATLKCDIHGWMKAYAGVLNHPFFAVTGPDGRFELKGLPAGNYTLATWHERFGEQVQKITLLEKESKVFSFTFKL